VIVRRSWRWGLGAIALAVVAPIAADRALPPPLDKAEDVSVVVTDRDGLPLRAFPVEDGRWRLPVDPAAIDPALIEAVIAIEDKRFYRHPGVDLRAMARATADMIRHGEIRSGASTITMQTVRLLEPRPRTLGAKLVEICRAIQLERHLSKDEILSIYLTLAPYGGNLEGVRSASWAYFGREPAALGPDEIALLVALPQAPEARRPDRRPDAARAARARILERLAAQEIYSPERARDAAAEALPMGRAAFPADAWHAAEHVAGLLDRPRSVRSTLDSGLQKAASARIADAASAGGEGVQAAALIVEIETRAVRAHVGSAGRDRDGGWLDLTARSRSPGSTLKPLVYGIAFDDGIASPQTLIDDLPSRFAGYRPENFDRTFRGEVTVAAALQHSLNVPAVRLLDQVGTSRFLAALAQSGSRPTVPSDRRIDPGLAVALGGLGLTAQEVATLYAALGDGGRTAALRWIEDEPVVEARHHIMTAESADEILAVLRGAPAPPGRMPAALTQDAPKIAFKTGTSYGFRDAWAAGVADGYAIVVWIGRPDGAPRPGVTGRAAALPVLFDLFDLTARRLGRAGGTPSVEVEAATPAPLARFENDAAPPQILFPPEGAEIWAGRPGKSFVLSARGTAPLAWYVEGRKVPQDAGGMPVWAPPLPGFYDLAVVDAEGRTSRTRVRVRMPNDA
jgi:penicillin-binding protein 1C